MSVALPDLEPEVVCCNMRTGKADGMGVILTQSFSNSIVVNLQAARKALSPECAFARGNLTGSSRKIIELNSYWKTWAVRMVHRRERKSADNDSEDEDDNSNLPYFPFDYFSDEQTD